MKMNPLLFLVSTVFISVPISIVNCDTINGTLRNVTYLNCQNCSNFLAGNETGFQDCSDTTTCVGNLCFVVMANDQFPLHFAGCLNLSTTIDFGGQNGLCNVGENVSECICNSKDACNDWRGTKGFASKNEIFVGIDFNLTSKAVTGSVFKLADVEIVSNGQNQMMNGNAGLDISAVTPTLNSANCYSAVKLTTAILLLVTMVGTILY